MIGTLLPDSQIDAADYGYASGYLFPFGILKYGYQRMKSPFNTFPISSLTSTTHAMTRQRV